MDSVKKNADNLNKAINNNAYRHCVEKTFEKKYSHEEKKNFPDYDRKSKFDMTDKYFKTHMKSDKYNKN